MNKLKAFLLVAILNLVVLSPAHAQTFKFEEDGAEPQFNLSFGVTPATGGNLVVAFDYLDDKNHYLLEIAPKNIALHVVVSGNRRFLGTTPAAWAGSGQVTLKRRPWLMQVIVDQSAVLTAYDATFDSGKIGVAGTGGWAWKEPRIQPVEELYFADDFTRTAEQENQWKAASGKWELTASSDKINAKNVEMSANPFSYSVSAGEGPALSQVGRWFWADYDAQVSVRPAARGTIGLAAYVQDAKNYLAFRWSATEGPAARQLVQVVDGKTTVIQAAPGAFLPRQWYRLSIRTSPGFVEAFIDGTLVLKGRNERFAQGGIALLVADSGQANFDDVLVRSYSYYPQDFLDESSNSAWTANGGKWQGSRDVMTSAAAPDETKGRMFLAGRNDWTGYEFAAAPKVGEAGAGGIILGYRNEKDYALFRWAGAKSTLPYKGRQQLVRVLNDTATIVSDEPATLSARTTDGHTPLRATLHSGIATIYASDDIVGQLADETLAAGRVGLWAEGATPVAFRDVTVFFPPAPLPPKVASKMASDMLMSAWSSQAGEWPPVLGAEGIEFWNPSDFFGDGAFEYPWRRNGDKPAKLEIALRALRDDFASGYIVRCEGQTQPPALKVSVLRGGQVVKETSMEWKELPASQPNAAPAALRIALEGRTVLVSLEEKPILSYRDASATGLPAGTGIAARAKGFAVRTKEIRIVNTNRDDYTFTEAPTAWYAPQGQWTVASRWPCTSDWSFFGGIGLNPALWTKREYRGDTVVEMYVHNQMDLPKEMGYSSPGDLNLTIAGDGKTPASGYSFIVGGWDYTRNAIMRGDKIVAQNMATDARFPFPLNHNSMWHNRWSYVRAEARRTKKEGRDGVQLNLFLDDTPLLDYFDPTPLPAIANGGRVALWTVDGTLMIARAKIGSSDPGQTFLPEGLPDASQPLPATTIEAPAGHLAPRVVLTDGQPSAIIERSADATKAEWTMRNPTAGGYFAVRLGAGIADAEKPVPITASRAARLEMDIAMPADVKIDLYATIDGVRHLIGLSGGQKPDARVRNLGTAILGAPSAGGWRTISFDLGAALSKLYLKQQEWKLEALEIGAFHGDEYRWLGFGGNPLGATYRVRNVTLKNGN